MPHPDTPEQRADHEAYERDPAMSTVAIWAVMIGLGLAWGLWAIFGAGSGR